MSAEPTSIEQEPQHPDQDVTVTVFAPRDPDGDPFTWNKHQTVGVAAQEVADAFGYSPGTPTLAKDGVALDRDKQLVAAGVHEGDRLELVDTGGGV